MLIAALPEEHCGDLVGGVALLPQSSRCPDVIVPGDHGDYDILRHVRPKQIIKEVSAVHGRRLLAVQGT